jgi:hypothetical protein
MKENFENQRKFAAIVIIIIALLLMALIVINVLKNNANNASKNEIENGSITPKDVEIYVTTADGDKINTNEKVAENKQVGSILIEKTEIVYEKLKATSTLAAKVTNDSIAKDNLRFNVKFIAADGTTITEMVGYIGSIKANETKYINSSTTKNIYNASNIIYEIIE